MSDTSTHIRLLEVVRKFCGANLSARNNPTLTMSCSPDYTGGVRAQIQMRQTLAATPTRVVSTPEVVIAAVHEKIRDGQLTDESVVKFASDAIDVLAREIRQTQFAEARQT